MYSADTHERASNVGKKENYDPNLTSSYWGKGMDVPIEFCSVTKVDSERCNHLSNQDQERITGYHTTLRVLSPVVVEPSERFSHPNIF